MTNLVKSGDYTFIPSQLVMMRIAKNAGNPKALEEPLTEEKLLEIEAFAKQIAEQMKPFMKEEDQLADISNWPPPANIQKNLSSITAMLEKTKQKTGVEFNKLIGVAHSGSGGFFVSSDRNISIDYATIKEENFTHERLADIINHEAAHIYHRDLELNNLPKSAADQMNQLKVIKELHQDNPNLLYKIVQDNYESIEQFSNQISNIEDAINKSVEPISFAFDMDHHTILHDMYSDRKVEKALDTISSKNSFKQLNTTLSGLLLTFPTATKSQAIEVKEMIASLDQEGGPQAEMTKQHLLSAYESSFTQDQKVEVDISPADKTTIDNIISKKLLPLNEYPKKLKKLSREIVLAAEFRADDFSVAFSDKPQEAHLCLAKQEQIFENIKKNNPEKFAQIMEGEEQDPHPALSIRIERSKKLGKYVAALRIEKGEEANLLEHFDMSIRSFSLLPTEQKSRSNELY